MCSCFFAHEKVFARGNRLLGGLICVILLATVCGLGVHIRSLCFHVVEDERAPVSGRHIIGRL